MTARNKHIHALKGPDVLAPDVIKDIVERRNIPDACNKLAAHHGVSIQRIRVIWATYYGGTTLADYKTGLKKPLPTAAIPQKDITMRKLNTERAHYAAREPKTIAAAAKADIGARAHAVKKIPVKPQPNSDQYRDLELDPEALAQMDDEEAEIIAGEVASGNNSSLLREALNALVLTNKNLSSITKQHLRAAYNEGRNKKSNSGTKKSGALRYNDETSNESETDDASNSCAGADDVSEETDSELDATDDEGQLRCLDGTSGPGLEGCFESGGTLPPEYYDNRQPPQQCINRGIENRDDYIRRGAANQRGGRASIIHSQLGNQGATGPAARARPVFTNGGSAGPESGPLQADYLQAGGYEQEIPPAQHYKGQERVQSHYARYDDQQLPLPSQGNGVSRPGGNRPGQGVAGISWLRPRPV